MCTQTLGPNIQFRVILGPRQTSQMTQYDYLIIGNDMYTMKPIYSTNTYGFTYSSMFQKGMYYINYALNSIIVTVVTIPDA